MLLRVKQEMYKVNLEHLIVPESKRCTTNRHTLREGGRSVIRTAKPNVRTLNGQHWKSVSDKIK